MSRIRPVALTALLTLSPLFAPTAAQAQVQWRSAPRVDVATMSRAQKADVIDAAREAGNPYAVVHLAGTLDDAGRAALEASGVSLLAALGDDAFFANVSAADGGRLGAVRAIEPIARDHKLHPFLAAGAPPDYSVVRQIDAPDGTAEDVVGLYVIFHRDVRLADGVAAAVALGADVRDRLETVNGLVIELPVSRIAALADRPAVQWLEPPLPRMSTTNAENRALTEANVVQEAPYALDGTGVTAFVYDGSSAFAGHQDFSGRLTVIDGDGVSDHATHVSGTIGGDGSITPNNRGMAPDVTLLSAGFEHDGSGIFLYSNPGDIENDYGVALSQGADVSNNSIGSNTESNGFPCEIQGDYGVTASVIDGVVGGSLGEGLIVVWATGNERQGSDCDIEGFGDYYSMAPPANAKNQIAVGALNANDDSMTSFSSWGPTDDGRMKPDVCAPGCQSGGDGGVTSTSSSGGYNVKCGTSMASPTVCGLVALILEDYRVQFPALSDPLASTMKTLLAHTAVDLGNPGPDYQFGYGSVRVQDAVDFMRTGQFTEQEIDQGEVHAFDVEVGPGAGLLKFTLAWSDPPATPNVQNALVNDLDLRAIDPGGGVHRPWSLDPQDPSAPAVQTRANGRDNIEQVLVSFPAPGTWTIEVIGTDVPEGPQAYALAGTPSLDVSIVAIGLASAVPDLVAPGDPLEVDVAVTAINDTVVPGSERLFYRFDGGSFIETALVADGDGYTGTVPGAGCTDTPQFYVQVEGAETGLATSPPGGATDPYSYGVGVNVELFADTFETDEGWTVSGSPADGPWERGVPVGGGDRGDPPFDADGSGQCYLTDNEDDNSDVDGGSTTLTSPVMDASGGDVVLSYHRWFSNDTGDGAETDAFTVEISDDAGGSWSVLEVVGPAGPEVSGGWFQKSFALGELPGFAANDQFRIRFTAEDVDPQSIVEAGVDGVALTRFECEDGGEPCPADIDASGAIDVEDLVLLVLAWGPCPGCAEDIDGDGDVDVEDLVLLVLAWGPCE